MNESLLFLGIGLGCLLLGSVLGYFIARLKNKSETGMLNERLNLKSEQLSQSENKLKEQNLKSEHLQQKKEFLQNELTSTTVAYQNE